MNASATKTRVKPLAGHAGHLRQRGPRHTMLLIQRHRIPLQLGAQLLHTRQQLEALRGRGASRRQQSSRRLRQIAGARSARHCARRHEDLYSLRLQGRITLLARRLKTRFNTVNHTPSVTAVTDGKVLFGVTVTINP